MPFKYNIPGQGVGINPTKYYKPTPLGSSVKLNSGLVSPGLPGTGDAHKGKPTPTDPSKDVVFSPAAAPPTEEPTREATKEPVEDLPTLPPPDKDNPDTPIDLPTGANDEGMSWVIPVVGIGLVALAIGVVVKTVK